MLTAQMCAELGGFSRRHIINKLHSGEIKGVRVGNAWRVGRDYYLRDVLKLEA
jgi:excisionase family DNA binding protein